jgi:hypothetical protein
MKGCSALILGKDVVLRFIDEHRAILQDLPISERITMIKTKIFNERKTNRQHYRKNIAKLTMN